MEIVHSQLYSDKETKDWNDAFTVVFTHAKRKKKDMVLVSKVPITKVAMKAIRVGANG